MEGRDALTGRAEDRWAWLARALTDLVEAPDAASTFGCAVALAEAIAPGWRFIVVQPGEAARADRGSPDAARDWGAALLADRAAPTGVRAAREVVLPREDGWACAAPIERDHQTRAVLVGLADRDALRPEDPSDLARMVETIAAHAGASWAAGARLAEQAALANRDPLTGLLNHRRFHETLASEIERCRQAGPSGRVALVLFDLDGFKGVNDSYGHGAGDRVLRSVAGRMASACRAEDLAFRIGGDEFAVVLRGAGRADAGKLAERVRSAVATIGFDLGPSSGVASWPADGATKEQIIGAADARLRAGKHPARLAVPDHHGGARANARLALASRLATKLAPLQEEAELAQLVVDELHETFHYYLAVVQRLDGAHLQIVAAAGPLTGDPGFLAYRQGIEEGVNGRVARTGATAVVPDTRKDPDYLRRDPSLEPGSELSLPIRVDGRLWGVLNIEELSTHAFDEHDVLLAEAIAAQIGAAIHRAELSAETESALVTTLATLTDALEAKDRYTASHAREVSERAEEVARSMGVSGLTLRNIRYAALMHDIGKVAVRTEILAKRGPLSDAEFEEIKAHANVGADMLERIRVLASVAPLVRASHERWDGRGYPRRLAGKAIPLGARIVCVCDAFDAMTSDRPYRDALSHDAALEELELHAGTQFDPAVVDALVRIMRTGAARAPAPVLLTAVPDPPPARSQARRMPGHEAAGVGRSA